MNTQIPYSRPSITDLEISYVTDAAANGWGDQCYTYINRFEELFKEHLGVNYAIATSSCTGALHMGMAALGIGPGDEVIMADTNWVATVSPVVNLGATPVFVDILENSWCVDPNKVEAAITPKTKAIVAVHLYGNLCEMDHLLEIGNKYNIPVIEDAAEAIGSQFKAQRAGSMGVFGTFSFHGTKTLTTGEGGMFVTNDKEMYDTVLMLSNHGRAEVQSKQFWPDKIGFKYKMSNLQAAVGCAQIERIEELVAKKREIFAAYRERLMGFPAVTMNPEPRGTINGFWMPTVVFDRQMGVTRGTLQKNFTRANVDARVFFWPLSSLPMFDSATHTRNAQDIANRAINLPSYHDMGQDDIERVVRVIIETYDLAEKYK